MQNPLAKQDRIEQDFDGSFYLIRKASKSKDFSIDFGEGGTSPHLTKDTEKTAFRLFNLVLLG